MTAPISHDEQASYVKRVSDQLKHTLPPGWEYAQVQFREIGGHRETNAIVYNVANRMEPWAPPAAVGERFHELREATRGNSHGPWYSAKFELKFSGEETLATVRSDEPQWITAPPREAYEQELGLPGGAPEWLRARLGAAEGPG